MTSARERIILGSSRYETAYDCGVHVLVWFGGRCLGANVAQFQRTIQSERAGEIGGAADVGRRGLAASARCAARGNVIPSGDASRSGPGFVGLARFAKRAVFS
jgi:hypothetical protein